MPLLEIIQLDSNSLLRDDASISNPDENIQKLVRAIEQVNPPVDFVLGTHHQDKNAIQITFEHRGSAKSTTSERSLGPGSLSEVISGFYDAPFRSFRVNLDNSVFGPAGFATANAVEFVLSYFPTSSFNAEFQKKIEDDFIRFDEIYSPATTGDQGLVYGWLEGEQPLEDVDGGSAKCFFVMRGWNSMDGFEASIKTEAYKEAIPLLLGWNAPFKMSSGMWSVNREIPARELLYL
ncbi:hypothetical protein N7509_002405 [Penicillium cosmopolitanum]|uniref:Uncharacterized protein n=1 Tax=Penicillium cosmopolitanum TaxID=1131564 RepID=A0A9X0BDA3_9EURO|nr:uncharacterized protein N7509_002405 [Penicillium cosmopolitanum]KAJ5408522.1 hypothetical protein N7509_002405 [Penicillium cosmopolitanum]